jgi:hypothetical protein
LLDEIVRGIGDILREDYPAFVVLHHLDELKVAQAI